MSKTKKNIIWAVTWTIVNVLFSMAYRLIEIVLNDCKSKNIVLQILDSFADQIALYIVGPLYGVIGAGFFLLIDSFFFRKKIANKTVLFTYRISLIILFIFIGALIDKYVLR